MSTLLRGRNDSTERWERRSGWCVESWRSDRLDSLAWGAIFLWAALVLLAEAVDYAAGFAWWDGWGVFFTGAGVVVLLEAAMRLLMPEYRASWWWTLVVGAILLSIGLDNWGGWAGVWALVMAAIGLGTLRSVFARGT